MPVSVAAPIAKRVTQWDEFSGRFEAVASVEVRARVSGFIEELHFKDGQLVNAGDPLVHHRQAALRHRCRERQGRRRAQQGAGRPGRAAGPARRFADNVQDHHRPGERPAQGQPRRREGPAQGGRGGSALRRAQPRLDRRARADRRPHLRPQGRCRQPDPGRPAGRHPARRHRHPRSHSLRVRRLGVGLSALHAPLPVGRAGLVARNQSRAHPAGRRNRMDAHRQGRLRRQYVRAALGHHPHPRRRRQQEPAPDARHLRPRATLRRRVRCRC